MFVNIYGAAICEANNRQWWRP